MTTTADSSDSDDDDSAANMNEGEKMFKKLTRARLKNEGKYFRYLSHKY